jgi:hypothetical protein
MVMTFRAAFSQSDNKYHWLVDLDFLLPTWAAAAINLAFWLYLVWVGTMFYRHAQGKERLLIAGWSTILLSPIKYFVSLSASAGIAYFETFGMVVAFLAAVCIVLQSSSSSNLERNTSGTDGA